MTCWEIPFPNKKRNVIIKDCSRKKGFSNSKVATVLCMLGKGYQLTSAGKETRIKGRDMRTLAQVW